MLMAAARATRNAGRCGGLLVASAASPVVPSAASPAVASTTVACSVRTNGCGIIISAPDEMASAVADISTTDPSETIARRSADDAAVLQSRHQQVANQRCNADNNSERHHRTSHRFLSCRSVELCIAKTPFPGHDSLLNMTAPFIEHSSAT